MASAGERLERRDDFPLEVYPRGPRGKQPVVEAGTAVSPRRLAAGALLSDTLSAAPPSSVPVLVARSGGPAERFATRLGNAHPLLVFLAALASGYALLVGLSVTLGLLVTKLVLRVDSIARADERVVAWLAAQRTPVLVDASWLGSTLAGGLVIPALIGAVVIACAIWRRWRIAAFVLFAVAVESVTYRATTLAVPRDRPDVDRLESLPADASFPSGHTAASIALFCGLAMLLGSWFRATYARVAIWVVALAIPPFVALSRMLRGMHHPLDVAAGVVIGIGALVAVLFAVRAAGAADDARTPRP
jgi:membrane-associated phospholipid phosphatase